MIEFKNVTFGYGKKPLLNQLNLSIPDGEFVVITGESGCGKTTLTRLINGLVPNYYNGHLKGEVLIDGVDVSQKKIKETGAIVGSVFQNPKTQFFNVDTTSELVFTAENLNVPVEEIQSRCEGIVQAMRLEPLMDRNLFELSGGEKQQIACASVAVSNQNYIVLDEPSSNLDLEAIERLKESLKGFQRQGKTIVIVEHRLFYLRDLLDRFLVMMDGQIVADMNRQEVSTLSNTDLSVRGLRPFHIETFKDEVREMRHSIPKEPAFCVEHLTNSYLHIDRLSFGKGEAVAVLGENGAGKTTLARILCGVNKKYKGSITLNGKQMKPGDLLKQVYMIFQDVNHQLFTDSVLEEVVISMNSKLPRQEKEQKAREILRKLDLEHVEKRHPQSLSGGQKQRVAIASAIASEREVLIFDEPTSGLDEKHMEQVAELLNMLKSMGHVLIIITHDYELVRKCCDSAVFMEKGGIKA